MKRALITIACLAAMLLLAVAAGAGWLYHRIQGHLTPPPDPPGQASIARYASASTGTARRTPEPGDDFDWREIATPPKSARAWTRWWWPGGDVEAQVLAAQLAELDAAGFGGAEIQPFISGIIPVAKDAALMERVYSFDTPAYYTTLAATMEAAQALGMRLDLTHFSGWPPGGPQVNLDDGLTIMAHGATRVRGGREIKLDLPRPRPGPSEYIFTAIEFAGIDFINFPADKARLLSVVAARPTAGKRARSPLDLSDTVTLDETSLQVITDQAENGVLRWQAPDGKWIIVASYLMPAGEVPMGAAQMPQGFVIDHLRQPQVVGHYEYAFGERTGLAVHYGEAFRGFFNDSLEFRLKRMSVDDILEQFSERRGYDIEPYLPAIYVEGIDNVYFREILGVHAAPEFAITDMDERIRHDYQKTLSDLIIERFVATSADWAAERGLVSRGQSYGMDIDILRALGANTIPETEQLWAGGADVGLKFASSAGALYGRPLIGAESFVWINRDYMPTARRIKAATDKLLLAGINHIVYHGTPYPWTGGDSGAFGEEGWAPFSGPGNPAHFTDNVSPGNTALWTDVPALNAYIARGQNLLRQGRPVLDVLVYYPYLGFHGPNVEGEATEALVAGALPDADPPQVALEDPTLSAGKKLFDRLFTVPSRGEDERVAWVRQLQPLLRELDRRGISWGWVNGHALRSGLVAPGALTASGGQYSAILLPGIDSIEPATLDSLGRLLSQDVPVVLAGRLPERQPGFKDAVVNDAAVRARVGDLVRRGARQWDFDPVDLADQLAALVHEPVAFIGGGAIQRHRRRLDDGGSIHFFANQSAAPASQLLALRGEQQPWWFDAMTGTAWPAGVEDGMLRLSLGGFDSRFLMVDITLPPELHRQRPAAMALESTARRWPLTGWEFNADAFSANWDSLPDWRDVEALRHNASGRYRHHLTLDKRRDDARYLLDLGLVQGSAAVSVNGQAIGRASLPPFAIDITDAVISGDNTIEIEILAPLRNVFVGRALDGDERYRHMAGYADALVAAGLMGPVALAEVIDEPVPPVVTDGIDD